MDIEWLLRIFLSFLRSSLTSSIFIVLFIIILAVFDKKINVRVKNVLWIMILIKLLIPVTDQINTNLFVMINHTMPAFHQEEPLVTSQEIMERPFSPLPANKSLPANYEEHQNAHTSVLPIMACIWFAGVILFSTFLTLTQIKFKRKIKSISRIDNSQSLSFIDDLKKQLAIKKEIPIVLTDQIGSPCISGIIKPTIYIPEYILTISDKKQLSHIFLHELIHYKRKDLIYNFLSILAMILHWYNPFVWLAGKKMRLYRECACDACVLELLNEEENIDYGMTLLSFSRYYLNKNRSSQFPIYFESNKQVKDRIIMIKKFNKGSNQLTGKVVFCCMLAACILFTNNLQVKALNSDRVIQSTNEAPGQGKGWYQKDNKWHYKDWVEVNEDLVKKDITEDWVFDTGKWFYFDQQGDMVKDTTRTIDGKAHEFEKNGICKNKIVTDWVVDCNSHWYYFDENGIMLKNTTIGEKRVDENGILIPPESKYISDDPNDYPGWYQKDNQWHCKLHDKELISAWLQGGNNKWFYFDKQGCLVKDTTYRINKKDYIFTDKGVCINKDKGWEFSDGKWSYYDETGEIATDTVVDGYQINDKGFRVETDDNSSNIEMGEKYKATYIEN